MVRRRRRRRREREEGGRREGEGRREKGEAEEEEECTCNTVELHKASHALIPHCSTSQISSEWTFTFSRVGIAIRLHAGHSFS